MQQHSYIPLCIFLFVVMGAFIFCAYKLSQQTDKLYAGLDELWERARQAKTRGELQRIHDELGVYYKEHCWHRHHAAYAFKVKAYIEGKSAGLAS